MKFSEIMALQKRAWEAEQDIVRGDLPTALERAVTAMLRVHTTVEAKRVADVAYQAAQALRDKAGPGGVIAATTIDTAIKAAENGRAGDDMLLGSSVLPGMIHIAEGLQLTLGDVVASAHAKSGLTVAEWNELADADREARLDATVATLRNEAAEKRAPIVTSPATGQPREGAKSDSPAGTIAADGTDLDKLTKRDLVARGKAIGLDLEGNKPEMIAAILAAEAGK